MTKITHADLTTLARGDVLPPDVFQAILADPTAVEELHKLLRLQSLFAEDEMLEPVTTDVTLQEANQFLEGKLPDRERARAVEAFLKCEWPETLALKKKETERRSRRLRAIITRVVLAASVLIALAHWPCPDGRGPGPFAQAKSRVVSASLAPRELGKAPVISLNAPGSESPARYQVTVTNITYKLECRVRTPRSRGAVYQIGQHGITRLGSFDRGDAGIVIASCDVQFDEQPGHDLFVIVLFEKDGESSHLAESMDGFVGEEEREKLVEAAGRPDVQETTRRVIDSTLRKAGWGDSPVDVLVVATIEHVEP